MRPRKNPLWGLAAPLRHRLDRRIALDGLDDHPRQGSEGGFALVFGSGGAQGGGRVAGSTPKGAALVATYGTNRFIIWS